MSKFKNITDEQFIDAVNESRSIRQVLITLGLKEAGGNYDTVKRKMQNLGLNVEEVFGDLKKRRGWCKGKKFPYNHTLLLEDILIENSTYVSSNGLKKRLLNAGLLTRQCSKCKLTKWLGDDIAIELDHINGIKTDNRLENLRILCPNCHAQTDTYKGKNIKLGRIEIVAPTLKKIEWDIQSKRIPLKVIKLRQKKIHLCLDCGKEVGKKTKRCATCSSKNQERIVWPDTKTLIEITKNSSFLAVARELGVSDNAIRSRIKKHPE